MSRVHEALSRARAGQAGIEATGLTEAPAGAPLFLLGDAETASLWASEAKQDADKPVPEAGPSRAPAAPVDSEESRRQPPSSALAEPFRELGEKLVVGSHSNAASVEQYRSLAGRLHLAQAEHEIKVVVIASALPGEGKSLTAANLALTLSESYHRNVLLIDGDLRRPSVHEMFQIPNVSGLNEGLRSETERKVPLIRWSEHLTLITAGRPDTDPMNVLTSLKMRKVISEAASKFDWVIIDTPPVGLLTDASLFAAMVDTVVLVIEADRTPCGDVERAIQAIGRERIFGVVLNKAQERKQRTYAADQYNYGSIVTPV